MGSKTTSANRLRFVEAEASKPGPDTEYAIHGDKPPYIVSPHKLNLLFDSDENDDALFARLKRERQLYREFNNAEDPHDLRQRVLTELNRLGFSEYSFLRLNRVQNPAGGDALIPTELLSSYSDQTAQQCGLMLRASFNSTRNRHLSALFYCVASATTTTLHISGDQYVLIVGNDGAGCFLIMVGQPAGNRYLWSSGPDQHQQPPDSCDFQQRVARNQYALSLLATTIEAVGTNRFPCLFKREPDAGGAAVTPRPLRLLNTLAKRDATLREAADHLCLSTDTINKHVAAAKSALGTNTLTGTLWKDLKAGLMDTEEN